MNELMSKIDLVLRIVVMVPTWLMVYITDGSISIKECARNATMRQLLLGHLYTAIAIIAIYILWKVLLVLILISAGVRVSLHIGAIFDGKA